jgi:predicted HD phosphohydrolase
MSADDACNQIVDTIFKVLIDGSKRDYIGERISQLEHCLQAASQALDAGNKKTRDGINENPFN